MAETGELPKDRLERFRFFFHQAKKTSEPWRTDAKEDYSFTEGYGQWFQKEKNDLNIQNRPALVMNSILPVVNLISGQERASRLGITYKPRGFDDDRASQIANQTYRFAADNSNLIYEVSDAFQDMTICGRGFLYTTIDYNQHDEPLGEISVKRIHPLSLFWDENATRYDMQDASYMIWAKWVSEDMLRIYYPSAMSEIKAGEWLGMPADLIGENTLDYNWRDKRTGKLRILEFWYKVPKQVAFVITDTGVQRFDTVGKAKEAIEQVTRMASSQFAEVPNMEIVERVIKETRVSHVTAWKILKDSPSPHNHNEYPIIPFTAYNFDEKVMGIVRSLKDPQREKNKRWSQMLHMINTMAKGGWKIPKRSISPEQLSRWSTESGKPGFWFEFNPLIGEPKEIDGQNIPTSFVALMQIAGDEIKNTSGAIQELQGLARGSDQSGKAIRTLQQSGATILAPLFDSLVRSQKILGQQVISLIQQYYAPEKIIDILGISGISKIGLTPDNVYQFIERSLEAKYDTVVDVTPLLGSDRERQFQQALGLIDTLAKIGVPPPKPLLELLISVSDWPGKDALIQEMNQEPMQSQQPEGGGMSAV